MSPGCAKKAQFSKNARQLVPDAGFQLDLMCEVTDVNQIYKYCKVTCVCKYT